MLFPEKFIRKIAKVFSNRFFFAKNHKKQRLHEFRANCSNEPIWYKVAANIILDQNQNAVFYGRLTDIGDIKKRELQIIESVSRYQFALKASKNGIWDCNLMTEQVFF